MWLTNRSAHSSKASSTSARQHRGGAQGGQLPFPTIFRFLSVSSCGNSDGGLGLKQASRARVASFGCASWHKANLEAAQRTMLQVARDEMACAKRTFGTFPH